MKVREVFDAGGVLPLEAVLRCRLKFITRGVIFGSREFVMSHAPASARHRESKPLPRWSTEGEFVVLRAGRGSVIG